MQMKNVRVITWMHTFSPAKSWILGLQEYQTTVASAYAVQ